MTPPELLPEPCPVCGRKAIIGEGKKTGCQMHGEPMQAATVSCRPDCFGRPFVSAGDIYNGGKLKARQEAIKIWNEKCHASVADLVQRELAEAYAALDKLAAAAMEANRSANSSFSEADFELHYTGFAEKMAALHVHAHDACKLIDAHDEKHAAVIARSSGEKS